MTRQQLEDWARGTVTVTRWVLLAVVLILLLDGRAWATVTGEWRVNLLRGTSTQATVTAATEAAAWAACQARIPTTATASQTWTCQTMRYVATVTPDPAPVPVDCAVSDWSAWTGGAWSACSDGTQTRQETRTRTVLTQPANGGAACPVLTETRTASQTCTVEPPPVDPPAVTGVWTDLATAPVGAFVTVNGMSGAVAGAELVSQAGTKTVLRWTGDGATIGGQPVPVTTRAGRVVEATTATVGAAISGYQSGDVIYLRGGTYSGRYGSTTWGGSQFTLGGEHTGMALVCYPGETCNVRDFRFDINGSNANNVTVAGMSMVSGWQCVHGGAWTGDPNIDENGATGGRIVNNSCRATYGTANTQTGLIGTIGGDGWKILGNLLHDTGSGTPINQNHGIYIQVGADDAEIAYNTFRNLRMGHVVQFHTDGNARTYLNGWVHDNLWDGTDCQLMRGFNAGNASSASRFLVERNVFRNIGGGVSAVMLIGGVTEVRNNFFENICAPQGAAQLSWSGQPRGIAIGNVFKNANPNFGASNGASMSQWTLQ